MEENIMEIQAIEVNEAVVEEPQPVEELVQVEEVNSPACCENASAETSTDNGNGVGKVLVGVGVAAATAAVAYAGKKAYDVVAPVVSASWKAGVAAAKQKKAELAETRKAKKAERAAKKAAKAAAAAQASNSPEATIPAE